jgi:hypothetical protein
MLNKPTNRGFSRFEFKDEHGDSCSLQKSSSAMQECIWLGHNDIALKTFVPYGIPDSWKEHTEDEIKKVLRPGSTEVLANTRMHLTREQVAALLPHLTKFVETGELE